MKKKEVKIVQKEANKRIAIGIVVTICVLLLAYIGANVYLYYYNDDVCKYYDPETSVDIYRDKNPLTGKEETKYRCCNKDKTSCETHY